MLISVLLPIYNVNMHFFKKSLSSILNQTYDDYELIIIMDPSQKNKDDYVLNYLSEYEDDNRIKIINNDIKQGLTNCLNMGIKKSKGKYIARMDADDYSLKHRFEYQVEKLKNDECDLIGSWSIIINERDGIIGYHKPNNILTSKRGILLHNPFVHSSIMLKKNIFQKVGYYNPYFEPSEDYEFYLRLFSKGFKAINLNHFLHYYRFNTKSIIHGEHWRLNRTKYLYSKIYAVQKYKYINLTNLFFLLITPLSFIISPDYNLIFKHVFINNNYSILKNIN